MDQQEVGQIDFQKHETFFSSCHDLSPLSNVVPRLSGWRKVTEAGWQKSPWSSKSLPRTSGRL